MGKLSYSIKRALEEADEMFHPDKRPSFIVKWSRFVRYFVTDLWYDYPHVWISKVKYIHKNFMFFLPHIIHMRDWGSNDQINLFCDGLKYLAQGLKNQNHLKCSERNYKRCLFASERLRRAYDDRAYDDKSYVRLSKANPIRFIKCPDGRGSQMHHDYSKGGEYYTKMFKLIQKRQDRVMNENKKEAWAYLNKYIESFWD